MDKKPSEAEREAPEEDKAARAETAQALFERIRRRRDAGVSGAGTRATPTSGARSASVGAVRIDEILGAAPGAQHGESADSRAPDEAASAVAAVADAPAGQLGGTPATTSAAGPFPRSATMRLLLKHPELALGVGLPAAGLILGFPKSRRLLGAAIRLGTRPEVQQAMQLTSVLRQRGRRRSRSEPESG